MDHKANKLPRNVRVLSITSYLTDVSSEMLLNLLPLYLTNVMGVTLGVVGLIEGLAETTSSLVKLLSGIISDKFSNRKQLAVLGYGLSAIAKPFLLLAGSWPLVLLVRFTDRVGKGIRTAPRDALLANSVPPEKRGWAFGLHRAADTAGAFTGLGIATLIIWLSQANAERLTANTFQWIILASIIPAFLAVAILALGAVEVKLSAAAQAGAQPKQALDPRFKLFLGVMVLFTLGNSADAFIVLRAQERGLTLLQIMGMLLTFTGVYSIFSGPAGALSDRIGRRPLLLAGWLIYAAIYLGFALSESGAQVWLLYGLYGLYYAASEGVAKALIPDLVPAHQRGAAFGLYHAAIGLAALPASFLAGILWQGLGAWPGFGPAAPFYFGGGLALLSALLFLRFVKTS